MSPRTINSCRVLSFLLLRASLFVALTSVQGQAVLQSVVRDGESSLQGWSRDYRVNTSTPCLPTSLPPFVFLWPGADQATHRYWLMAGLEPHSGSICRCWLRHMSALRRAHSIMANEVKRPSNIYKSVLCSLQCGGAAVLTQLLQPSIMWFRCDTWLFVKYISKKWCYFYIQLWKKGE